MRGRTAGAGRGRAPRGQGPIALQKSVRKTGTKQGQRRTGARVAMVSGCRADVAGAPRAVGRAGARSADCNRVSERDVADPDVRCRWAGGWTRALANTTSKLLPGSRKGTCMGSSSQSTLRALVRCHLVGTGLGALRGFEVDVDDRLPPARPYCLHSFVIVTHRPRRRPRRRPECYKRVCEE